jgi:hypothetical protein
MSLPVSSFQPASFDEPHAFQQTELKLNDQLFSLDAEGGTDIRIHEKGSITIYGRIYGLIKWIFGLAFYARQANGVSYYVDSASFKKYRDENLADGARTFSIFAKHMMIDERLDLYTSSSGSPATVRESKLSHQFLAFLAYESSCALTLDKVDQARAKVFCPLRFDLFSLEKTGYFQTSASELREFVKELRKTLPVSFANEAIFSNLEHEVEKFLMDTGPVYLYPDEKVWVDKETFVRIFKNVLSQIRAQNMPLHEILQRVSKSWKPTISNMIAK